MPVCRTSMAYHGTLFRLALHKWLYYKKEILRKFSKLMKEISFKMRKNYEQNRKFCVVKVETLTGTFMYRHIYVLAYLCTGTFMYRHIYVLAHSCTNDFDMSTVFPTNFAKQLGEIVITLPGLHARLLIIFNILVVSCHSWWTSNFSSILRKHHVKLTLKSLWSVSLYLGKFARSIFL